MNWTLKPTKEINGYGETTVEKNTNGWKDGWMAKWTKLTKWKELVALHFWVASVDVTTLTLY